MQMINQSSLANQVTFVKCFDELPDTIFTAAYNPQTNATYLQVMFAQTNQISDDPHQGPFTDIHYMVLNGQRIVLTASQDCKIRAYKFGDDNSLQKLLEHPIQNAYVTRFVQANESFLICSLSNGKFLGWNLGPNSFDESPGHDNQAITAMYKHQSFILSADQGGNI